MVELLIIIGVVVLVGLFVAMLYNRLVAGKNQVENGWSQIDVQLKRRHDLIPNLVEVAKDYMDYEQETLQQVIAARQGAVTASKAGDRAGQIQAEGMLGAALGKFFALAEDYPDLKANENVANLMEELSGTENKIAFSRQFYNDSVLAQNTRVESFPSNIVANMFRFTRHPYFEVPEEEKAPVKVDLR
ncbi:MAG: LemA family protein [Alphaproteobacteria bacterium]|nr:LemA family protein [Alphaproteobacteria bacterium]